MEDDSERVDAILMRAGHQIEQLQKENTHMRNALKDIKAAIKCNETGAPVSMCVPTVWGLVNGGLDE